MYPLQEILDSGIDRLELSAVTNAVLKKRFGNATLVREIAMLGEEQIKSELQTYHTYPSVFVKDINAALGKHKIALGTSWAELPPSTHRRVRNPQQMCAERDRETSIRFREPKGGGVFVSVVVSLEGDLTRLILPETECQDQQTAMEIAMDHLGKSNAEIMALPYRDP